MKIIVLMRVSMIQIESGLGGRKIVQVDWKRMKGCSNRKIRI